MAGRMLADRRSFRLVEQTLFDHITNHRYELWMSSGGCGTNHVEAMFLAQLLCFRIKVEEHFHVIGDESDWDDDNVLVLLRVNDLLKEVADIGLQPRLSWRAAAALIHQLPWIRTDGGGN